MAPERSLTGLSWGEKHIYIGQVEMIIRLDPDGGEPEVIVSLEPGEIAGFPHLLPDGETLLFTLQRSLQPNIVAQSLVSGKRRELIQNGSDAAERTQLDCANTSDKQRSNSSSESDFKSSLSFICFL